VAPVGARVAMGAAAELGFIFLFYKNLFAEG
jgi:hypothetical protein